jgi:peptide/nickel transport system permease protein
VPILRVLAFSVIGLLGVAVLAPAALTSHDPYVMRPEQRLQHPDPVHWFGTDEFGRDVFTRVVYGARPSIGLALLVVALSSIFGGVVGLIAGYAGSAVEAAAMRVVDVFLAFPQLILAIAIAAALGQGVVSVVLGLAGVWWAQYARLMRAEVATVKSREFMVAAQALGARPARMLAYHVMPNCLTPLFVKIVLDFGLAILFVAALSFIGLGVKPPMPEWGAMVTSGRSYLIGYWWVPTFPGQAIFLAAISINILANELRARSIGGRAI